jgi:uncharacterized protein (UPF0297 family)
MNDALFKACTKYDKKQVYRLVKMCGANDFECLVEFGYYDLAVFVFIMNLNDNIKILKRLDKSDVVHLLNHGLPMYIPKYENIRNEYIQNISMKIEHCRDTIRLFDKNIVNYIKKYLQYRVQRSP